MPKQALKARIIVKQGGLDALTNKPLKTKKLSLVDTDRVVPKAEAGTYADENTRVLDPLTHMSRHGIRRTREEQLDHLKTLVDDRQQTIKLRNKVANQLLAYERHVDHVSEVTQSFLVETLEMIDTRLKTRTKDVLKAITAYGEVDQLAAVALAVPGLGPMTVAMLTVYIDLGGTFSEADRAVIENTARLSKKQPKAYQGTGQPKTVGMEKAASVSSLWAYAGLHKPSHQRHEKGVAGGGNTTLRCALWNMAVSMMKNRDCPYRNVYDRTKARLAASEKVVSSRNTQGKLVEVMWKDTKPSHRHGAALRAIMKHVLADYWMTGRQILGKDARPPYVQEKLGHSGIVAPRERGWIIPKA
jgi:hypothetical protein